MSALEDVFKKVLVFIGDLNRMDIRLQYLRKEAKRLGTELEELPDSEKKIERLKEDSNVLYDKIDDKLNGE